MTTMSDHPSLHRNNIRPEFQAAADAGAPAMSRAGAKESTAALRKWSKAHPSPFNFCRSPKPTAK